jgi:peptidoglycan/LPS O-acetylase OafA/YrhL
MIVFASLIKLHVLKGFAHPIILPFLFVMICLAFGILTHYIIERPILSWLRRFLGNRNRKEVQPLAKANRSVSIKASSTLEPTASTKPAS